MARPTIDTVSRQVSFLKLVAGAALFFGFFFGVTAFGLGLYSTITLKSWDDCTTSNCVSEGATIATCIQGTCVYTVNPFYVNQTSVAANYIEANYTTINNDLTVDGSIYLQTSGGVPSALNAYEVYNFNMTLYGPFTANQTARATIVHTGNSVLFHFYANVSATSTNTAVINSDPVLPSRFRPTYTLGSGNCDVQLSSNGTIGTGCFTVGSDGQVTISSSAYNCASTFLNGVTIIKPFRYDKPFTF
jgi:hypothetical protein